MLRAATKLEDSTFKPHSTLPGATVDVNTIQPNQQTPEWPEAADNLKLRARSS